MGTARKGSARTGGTKATRTEPIERATGRPWHAWLRFMEDIGAEGLGHAEIAARVERELSGTVDNPAWWAQGVTVAYEQHSGRRAPGQRADGSFQTTVSRTFALDMHALMEAYAAFAATDTGVAQLAASSPRRSGTAKRLSWRLRAKDGIGVRVTSEPRTEGSAVLVVTVVGLASAEAVVEAKAAWRGVLERFAATLAA